MTSPITNSSGLTDPEKKIISGFFCAILAISVLLALMVVVLSGDTFLAYSNYLQILTAFAGALVFLYAYNHMNRPSYLLYAAGGFALWGASNTAWYILFLIGMRPGVFPGLVDIGIIASIFVLTIAFQNAYPKKQVMPHILLGILIAFLLIPAGIFITIGVTEVTLVTFLYFFACASLVITGVNHSLTERPLIFGGALLFALAFLIYPIREAFFLTSPFLNIIGTLVIAGFCLIVIGLLGKP